MSECLKCTNEFDYSKYIVVFDMNGVLLSKDVNNSGNFDSNFVRIRKCDGFSINIYLNIHLDILSLYLKTHNFKKVLWTTMMRKNCDNVIKYLEERINVTFDKTYTQENCLEGKIVGNIKTKYCIKNLEQPVLEFKTKVENCLLIDDSLHKRHNDQHIYCFEHNSNAMIDALRYIDNFIGCKNQNCIMRQYEDYKTL